MANEENKGYKEFMEFVESATKEQIMDGIYRVIPQMCTEDTWAEFKERLDNLTDTLNYMSQWNRVCELLQECKEKWNKYSSELYSYEDYLKIRIFRELYDSEGGKKGTGFSFPEYLPGEAKGISDKIINSSRKKREMPIPPSDFYDTLEEVLKAAEPARQGLKCARVEALRELLTMLVFNIESDGTSKYGDYNLMIYDVEARKADHKKNGNTVTVLSAMIDNPTGYGRIIRDAEGRFVKSVEHKDASPEELESHEINSGMYIFDTKELKEALDKLAPNNAQGEYYLPDTLTIIKNKGLKVDAFALDDPEDITGVNDQEQLAAAAEIIRARTAK